MLHHIDVGPDIKRILLIDDDRELGTMLGEYLECEGFAVEVASDGPNGFERARAGEHDAIVLDLMLPGLSGLELLRKLRETSDVPIIMLSARGDQVDKVIGIELGADDYIAKPCYPRELVARLRANLRRRTPSTERNGPAQIKVGALQIEAGTRVAEWNGQPLELTATEFNLLILLARAGQVVTTKDELSQRALGRARQSYDRSVDVHISNIRIKLEAATSGAITIETVRGVGYRLRQS